VPESVDRDVLEFIGDEGKTLEEIAEQFPMFDLLRVIRPGLVEISRTATAGDVQAHQVEDKYVLTDRGASAVGVVRPSLQRSRLALQD
jgi:hypothetical protein